ncbi:MAG: hypothetical protein IKH32_04780 [Prevotella sp.]|nr:hypothetical protein [Prevotella sp.]
MKTKYFFIAAIAAVGLISCADDAFIAEAPPVNNVDEGMAPILFTSNQQAFTRADFEGKAAADLLGNQFVVTGFKGTSTATVGSIVFDNYVVQYAENTAHTTESNSDNWEYVGKGLIPHAKTNGITQQTIKYWDYTQTQYDFFAWSTGEKTPKYSGDPAAGEVVVSNIIPNSKSPAWATGGTLTRPVYTFTGTADDLSQCYISDLVTVYKDVVSGSPTYNVVSKGYQQPVKLKFRQLGTKVRIGIYETIPGYSVKDVQFYSAANVALVKEGDAIPGSDPAATYTAAQAKTENESAKIFTTVANDIYEEGTYTVYFPTVDAPTNADNNQAHIDFAPKSGADQKTTVDWGGLNYTIRESGESSTDAIYLGRTSNTASFAGESDDNYYVIYLPNLNGTNLNLRVNYTLESIDGSSEEITVKGATAQVPLIYTQWKPGYAYTYLFKISDKTNGYTGVYDPTKPDDTSVNSDPAGLYPITFDAVAVNAEEDAKQETITLVSTPSITTYQNGSNVVNNNEYSVLTSTDPKITGEIYVTVNDADAASYTAVTPAPTTGTSVAKYYKKVGDSYVACAANAVAEDGTTYYKKIEPALPNGTLATLTGKAALYEVAAGTTEAEVIDALQMQDDDYDTGTIKGRNKKVLTTSADPNALSLTNEVTYGADGNKITVADNQAAKFIPKAATTYAFVYTKQAPTATNDVPMYQALKWSNFVTGQTKYRYDYKAPANTDAQKGVKYFSVSGGVYTMETPFIGQGVSNLYLDADGNTIASGYAVTGTTYYYTDDNGQTYKAATNIPYASFSAATLYTDPAHTTAKTETSPVDGQAYYDANGKYCVIQPQQTTGWYELDTTKYVEASETAEVVGQTYFDKYIKNDGVYYTKIIKVQ